MTFFPPEMTSLTLLVPQFEAYSVVDGLIQSGNCEFQSSKDAVDQGDDVCTGIWWRMKKIKNRISTAVTPFESTQKKRKILITNKRKEVVAGVDFMRMMEMKEVQAQSHLLGLEKRRRTQKDVISIYDMKKAELVAAKLMRALRSGSEMKLQCQMFLIEGTNQLRVERLVFRRSRGHVITQTVQVEGLQGRQSMFVLLCLTLHEEVALRIKQALLLCSLHAFDFQNESLQQLTEREIALELAVKDAFQLLQLASSEENIELNECLRDEVEITWLQRLSCIVANSKRVGGSHILLRFQCRRVHEGLFSGASRLCRNPHTVLPTESWLQLPNMLTAGYAVPSYRQFIPSAMMLTTVPVLFGIMFSDAGHGFLLLLGCIALRAPLLCWLMSLMSIYCGFLFNEWFGFALLCKDFPGVINCEWSRVSNATVFLNSLKMKLSMIIALLHLSLGLFLASINALRQHRTLQLRSIVSKFVILWSTLGYLNLMIVKKWLNPASSTAPSLISCILEVFLGRDFQRTTSVFNSLQTEETLLFVIRNLIAVGFVTLLYHHAVSPLFRLDYARLPRDEENSDEEEGEEGTNENEKINEIPVQLGALEVFEFALWLVSSSASYLRLFALSLAHSKVSELVGEAVLYGLRSPNPTLPFLVLILVCISTLGFLIALDSLECLLHVVRLHWIQWMGAFYLGQGTLFLPESPFPHSLKNQTFQ